MGDELAILARSFPTTMVSAYTSVMFCWMRQKFYLFNLCHISPGTKEPSKLLPSHIFFLPVRRVKTIFMSQRILEVEKMAQFLGAPVTLSEDLGRLWSPVPTWCLTIIHGSSSRSSWCPLLTLQRTRYTHGAHAYMQAKGKTLIYRE